jgi:chromosome segregation ATPase
MQALKELKERIQALEAERKRLSVEIETLRKVAESRVSFLENELVHMRKESTNLRKLFTNPSENSSVSDSLQMSPKFH